MDEQNQFGPRKMFQGQWTCSKCGTEITELPFEPSGDRPIYCRNCHREMRQNRPQRRRF
jgi:CxxC-x17-CxxC domain-containing protein